MFATLEAFALQPELNAVNSFAVPKQYEKKSSVTKTYQRFLRNSYAGRTESETHAAGWYPASYMRELVAAESSLTQITARYKKGQARINTKLSRSPRRNYREAYASYDYSNRETTY